MAPSDTSDRFKLGLDWDELEELNQLTQKLEREKQKRYLENCRQRAEAQANVTSRSYGVGLRNPYTMGEIIHNTSTQDGHSSSLDHQTDVKAKAKLSVVSAFSEMISDIIKK